MRIFAINLKREELKKQAIIHEGEKYNLPIEIIEAIDAKQLSGQFIKERVYDYPNCSLTKGEIACALSHLSIYRKMIDENIPVALILEDDAIFNYAPNKTLDKLEHHLKSSEAEVYLLSGCLGQYYVNQTKKIDDLMIYKIYDSVLAHGYVITLAAAKQIYQLQSSLKFEADRWLAFRLYTGVKSYAFIPPVVETNDKSKQFSNLEKERSKLSKQREIYLYKLMRSSIKIKCKLFYIKKILNKIHKLNSRNDG